MVGKQFAQDPEARPKDYHDLSGSDWDCADSVPSPQLCNNSDTRNEYRTPLS